MDSTYKIEKARDVKKIKSLNRLPTAATHESKSSIYSQTLSAIHQNFDLMSQAVKESEQSAKETFFVNHYNP